MIEKRYLEILRTSNLFLSSLIKHEWLAKYFINYTVMKQNKISWIIFVKNYARIGNKSIIKYVGD